MAVFRSIVIVAENILQLKRMTVTAPLKKQSQQHGCMGGALGNSTFALLAGRIKKVKRRHKNEGACVGVYRCGRQ